MLSIELSGSHGDFGGHLSEVPWIVTLVSVNPYGQDSRGIISFGRTELMEKKIEGGDRI